MPAEMTTPGEPEASAAAAATNPTAAISVTASVGYDVADSGNSLPEEPTHARERNVPTR